MRTSSFLFTKLTYFLDVSQGKFLSYAKVTGSNYTVERSTPIALQIMRYGASPLPSQPEPLEPESFQQVAASH